MSKNPFCGSRERGEIEKLRQSWKQKLQEKGKKIA
jgi:hypothetical protein